MRKIRYVNSNGQEIDLYNNKISMDIGELLDYEWEYLSYNDRITGFNRNRIITKNVTITVRGSREDTKKIRDNLYNIFEIDIINNQTGKLYVNDYYLNCYIHASKKTEVLRSGRVWEIQYQIVTDQPFWIIEKMKTFSNSQASDVGIDFSYNYPFDYGIGNAIKEIKNDGIYQCDFELTIAGPCESAEVIISNHIYAVDVDLQSGQYLTINSEQETIYISEEDNTQVNVFDKRDRENYVFEKIPAGNNIVEYVGTHTVQLKLIMIRSEPEWT